MSTFDYQAIADAVEKYVGTGLIISVRADGSWLALDKGSSLANGTPELCIIDCPATAEIIQSFVEFHRDNPAAAASAYALRLSMWQIINGLQREPIVRS